MNMLLEKHWDSVIVRRRRFLPHADGSNQRHLIEVHVAAALHSPSSRVVHQPHRRVCSIAHEDAFRRAVVVQLAPTRLVDMDICRAPEDTQTTEIHWALGQDFKRRSSSGLATRSVAHVDGGIHGQAPEALLQACSVQHRQGHRHQGVATSTRPAVCGYSSACVSGRCCVSSACRSVREPCLVGPVERVETSFEWRSCCCCLACWQWRCSP